MEVITMKFSQSDIIDAHEHCSHNQTEIRESQMCGCFWCCAVFDSDDVIDFLESEETALCPSCGIDSVIGDASGYTITEELMQAMNKYWF